MSDGSVYRERWNEGILLEHVQIKEKEGDGLRLVPLGHELEHSVSLNPSRPMKRGKSLFQHHREEAEETKLEIGEIMHHLQENAERKQVKTFSCLENIDSLSKVTSFFIQKPDSKSASSDPFSVL